MTQLKQGTLWQWRSRSMSSTRTNQKNINHWPRRLSDFAPHTHTHTHKKADFWLSVTTFQTPTTTTSSSLPKIIAEDGCQTLFQPLPTLFFFLPPSVQSVQECWLMLLSLSLFPLPGDRLIQTQREASSIVGFEWYEWRLRRRGGIRHFFFLITAPHL